MAYVIDVDVGGTFTDAVLDDDAGTIIAAKTPSTPPDYSRGVLNVLGGLAEQLGKPLEEMLAETHHIAHGTTSSLRRGLDPSRNRVSSVCGGTRTESSSSSSSTRRSEPAAKAPRLRRPTTVRSTTAPSSPGSRRSRWRFSTTHTGSTPN
ncbi:hydantoinase/oxoprolinase N-terminal domain-containing protein [Streptomyces antimycoticus]|uniref:hydantoinase/oxoprolinase N-terminal domain-containing protein n=1 Tax=Streptomyces antimycoticus TaxID=68175 RepID=UPI001D143C35|nr:hydantoinase/oxoprolinase N-terminal domain-containing protein [Streptomyces antimycoticus]